MSTETDTDPLALANRFHELLEKEQLLEQWKKKYYDVADAVCRESASTKDLCNQARQTREQRNELRRALRVADCRCANIHHDKNQQHEIGEPCPVEAWLNSLL